MSRSQSDRPVSQLKEQASNVAESVKEMGQSVKDTAVDYYEQGRERAIEWRDQLEDYVREQPVKSLLIAAGIGALFGILWRR